MVRAALGDSRAQVRVVAIGAAARLNLLNSADIERLLDDQDVDVRYRVLEVLPALDDAADFAATVISFLDDPELSEIAAFTLGELTIDGPLQQKAVAALGHQATNHDDALSRESAVAALGALGDGLPFILAACGDVATVRRRAVLALAPFEGAEVEQALQTALDDRDWQVRQAAEDLSRP